ncbi:MAG TPA: hypothetical protein VFP59_08675 [Candidatus Angelobacter sp.]|nr:hypothetical protein [Candidatus Angelobacter sp.]
MRRHIATQDAELLDLLDRILDKGLFLGSANLLTLGDTDLSGSQSRISVISMYTNVDSYSTPARAARVAGATR